jgi:SlyX protein
LNESIRRLEEKVAYLERHVTEQDKAMLDFADEIAALRRAVKALQESSRGGGATETDEDADVQDERPPHF